MDQSSDPADPNDMLSYAPKWVRDGDMNGKAQPHPNGVGGNSVAIDLSSGRPFSGAERFQRSNLPGPSPVPVPPPPPSWPSRRGHSSQRYDDDSGYGNRPIFRFFLVLFLAALGAFVIVIVVPFARSFVPKSKAIDTLMSSLNDSRPEPPPAPPARAPTRAYGLASAAAAHLPPPPSPPRAALQNGVPRRAADAAARTAAWPTAAPQATAKPSVWGDPVPAAEPAAEAPAPVAPRVANITPRAAPLSDETAKPRPRESPMRRLGRGEIEILLKQGNDFVSVEDFSSARIVFRRVAEAGDARGALALAATYDPIMLGKTGAKGVTPDVAKARKWYRKARALGSTKAALRLDAIASQAR